MSVNHLFFCRRLRDDFLSGLLSVGIALVLDCSPSDYSPTGGDGGFGRGLGEGAVSGRDACFVSGGRFEGLTAEDFGRVFVAVGTVNVAGRAFSTEIPVKETGASI